MELFVLLAQQVEVTGNPIVEGAVRGAIFGGVIGGLIGVAVWGFKKLTGNKPKT